MSKPYTPKITLVRWAIRALAIFASTIAAIDFLRQDYAAGLSLTISWLLVIIAERRMFPSPVEGK